MVQKTKGAFRSGASLFIEDRLAEKEAPAEEPGPASVVVPAGGATPKAPKGYHVQFVENRSRRVQFMIAPSVYKAASAKAKKKKISLNEHLNRILSQDLCGGQDGEGQSVRIDFLQARLDECTKQTLNLYKENLPALFPQTHKRILTGFFDFCMSTPELPEKEREALLQVAKGIHDVLSACAAIAGKAVEGLQPQKA